MLLRRRIGAGCLAAVLLISLVMPRETRAAAPPLLVQDTEAQLVTAGCERVELADERAVQAAQALDWQAVVSSDATGAVLLFCPPSTAGLLNSTGNGQVAGLLDNIKDMTWGDWAQGAIVKILTGKSTYEYLGGKANDVATGATAGLFRAITDAGSHLLGLLARLIPPLLTQYEFINNKIVKQTWPIVLGAANAVFLLALVFIALLTALRLDIGGGVYKLLPRLLIAALLVNFSLVIAGVILDISRVVMALVVIMMSDPTGAGLQTIDDLPGRIVAGADAWPLFFSIDKNFDWAGWETTAGALISAIIMWAMVIAILIVVIGLIVRYVVLILLLIVSPLAYVFIALPGAGELAKRWWSTFLRYVIYGPVVLVLLIIAVDVTGRFNPFKQALGNNNLLISLMNSVMFCGFIIFAALAGRYAGIIGSATAMSMVSGAGRRLRRDIYRGAKKTAVRGGRVAAKGVYVGTGARAIVRRVRTAAGEFSQPILKAAGKRIRRLPGGRLLLGAERDEKGKPLKGEMSGAERLGRRWAAKTGWYPKGTTVQRWEDDMTEAGKSPAGMSPAAIRDKDGAYSRINNEHVGRVMTMDQTEAVINVAMNSPIPAGTTAADANNTHILDIERVKTLVRNHTAYNNIKEDIRAKLTVLDEQEIINNINNSRIAVGLPALDPSNDDDKRVIARIERVVRDIKSAADPAERDVTSKEWI